MADPTPLPSGLTHLAPQTSSTTSSTGGPLDLVSGTQQTQQYDPFSLDPTFGGTTFDVSRQTSNYTHLIPGGGAAIEPGDRLSVTEKRTTADTRTVTQFLQGIASNPGALKALQYALVGAGFNIDVTGSLDDKTMSVLSSLIGEAQRDGRSLMDIIDVHSKAQKTAKTKSLATQAQENFQQQVIAAYVSWWGVPPTQGWIDSALKSGQNLFEIEFNEKSKPAYQNSPQYQNNHNNIEGGLAGGALNTQTFTGAGNAFSPGPIA